MEGGEVVNVTVFYPKTPWASWNDTAGIAAVMRRMGHEVQEVPMPPGHPPNDEVPEDLFNRVKEGMPTLWELEQQDLILICGAEHLDFWIYAVYGRDEWKKLPTRKAALYHETEWREDGQSIGLDRAFWTADEHFFPGMQDAEFYDQEQFLKGHSHWSPFAVDTEVFNHECLSRDLGPHYHANAKEICTGPKKKHHVGFVGLTYGMRQQFLERLSQFQCPPIKTGQCVVQDIDGVNQRATAKLLAENYRETEIFFNLPSLSRLLVAKVFEVLACGTFLLTPALGKGAAPNMRLFEHGKELIYYRSVGEAARTLTEWVKPERALEREAIARAGCERVHRDYTLEKRLGEVLEKCGVKQTVIQ